jgi:exopolysaccharide biosynthesis WecB/TagA/CpsF family protein
MSKLTYEISAERASRTGAPEGGGLGPSRLSTKTQDFGPPGYPRLMTRPLPAVNALGFRIADVPSTAIVDALIEAGGDPLDAPFLAFALHVSGLLCRGNADYVGAMNEAHLVYADGVSAVLIARAAGAQRIIRAPTTDIGWQVLKGLTDRRGTPPRVAAIGGPSGLAQRALSCFSRAGVAQPCFAAHGFHEEWSEVLEKLSAADPEIVFIGMGSPREVIWTHRHASMMPNAVVMTCGGWFGHTVGDEARAPQRLQRWGLEWIYRAAQDPKRLAPRYARGALAFPFLITQAALGRLHSRDLR